MYIHTRIMESLYQKCVEKPDPCDPNPCGEGALCLVQVIWPNVCFFMKKKNFGSKGKMLRNISIFYKNIGKYVQLFTGYPCRNIFLLLFLFQNILHIFLIKKKYASII